MWSKYTQSVFLVKPTLLACQCYLLEVHFCCISYSLEFKYNLSIMRYFEYYTFSYENVIFYIRLPTVIKIPDDNDKNRLYLNTSCFLKKCCEDRKQQQRTTFQFIFFEHKRFNILKSISQDLFSSELILW